MTRIAPEPTSPSAVARPGTPGAETIDRNLPTIAVAGIPFTAGGPARASSWLLSRVIAGRTAGLALRFSNAYSIASTVKDETYRALLTGPGYTFPDGAPVAAFMRITDPAEGQASRVRGPSFFRRMLDDGRADGIRHYFLGATEETLAEMVKVAEREFPGIRIVGTFAPPFASAEEIVEMSTAAVLDARPDIVWVGLGSPKQDFVASELNARTGLVTAGVGAAFDFLAQTVKEAPELVQRLGMEWLFRFAAEPKRLWRRYVFGNGTFLIAAVRGLPAARRTVRRRRANRAQR